MPNTTKLVVQRVWSQVGVIWQILLGFSTKKWLNCNELTHVSEKHFLIDLFHYPDNNVHVANMGPTWVLSAPGGPHVVPMNLAFRVPFLHKLPYYLAWNVNFEYLSMTFYWWSIIGLLTPYCLTQRGHHCADATFKFLLLYKKWLSLVEILLQFVLIISIIFKPALVQIMAWHRTGVKPLESTMTEFIDECMRHSISLSKQLTSTKLIKRRIFFKTAL